MPHERTYAVCKQIKRHRLRGQKMYTLFVYLIVESFYANDVALANENRSFVSAALAQRVSGYQTLKFWRDLQQINLKI